MRLLYKTMFTKFIGLKTQEPILFVLNHESDMILHLRVSNWLFSLITNRLGQKQGFQFLTMKGIPFVFEV